MSNQEQQPDESGCGQSILETLLDSQFFKALSDRSRVEVLLQLVVIGNDKTVTEIAAQCPLSISVVSRHLKQLRDCGILDNEKRGKEVIYRFRNREVAEQLRALANAIETCC